MKRSRVIVALMCLAMTTSAVVAVMIKADFNGTWVMDPARTTGLPEGMKQTMTLVHKDDRIDIKATITSSDGDQNIVDAYILDGKEVDYTPSLPAGLTGKGKRTSKWSADGNGIEVSEVATIETPNGPIDVKTARKWTLMAEGRELTIEMKVESVMGVQESKRLFVKK